MEWVCVPVFFIDFNSLKDLGHTMSFTFHCTAYCMGHCTGKAAMKMLRVEGMSPKDFTVNRAKITTDLALV
jgi:hypothetical protein